MNVYKEVLEAEKRIRDHIRETSVEFSHYLSEPGNCKVFLKHEHEQYSGSFKLRGALNKYLSLSQEERDQHVVTASSGNHGAAFAYVLDKFGGKGTIYLPENAPPAKVNALKKYGVALKMQGAECIDSEKLAMDSVSINDQVYISPYNDPYIVGGQGTIGIELLRQIDSLDSILVPVGGGGLIAGIAGYVKSIDENIEVIGCQPENSAVMYESIKAGRIVEMESLPTISDGTAGGLETDSITFDLCREYVDDFILVSEEEIKNSIRLILEHHYVAVEGSAALQVAAFCKNRERFQGKNVALILSGKKIGMDTLRNVLK